jgi:hypothetical protein
LAEVTGQEAVGRNLQELGRDGCLRLGAEFFKEPMVVRILTYHGFRSERSFQERSDPPYDPLIFAPFGQEYH